MNTRTPSQIIDAHGGYVAFAEKLGEHPEVVRNWRRRDRFPADRYLDLAATIDGLSIEELAAMRVASAKTPAERRTVPTRSASHRRAG